MADAAIRERTSRRNIHYILTPAHNLGPLVAEYGPYRVLRHPCGFEVATVTGWHCYTAATLHDCLDYICECAVLRHGQ